ncbi:Sensor histidine kinase desK [Actinomyces bovis]|uniref:histidine kinase n=1 Tax=Actinomyces bovis TaxID=1658 RepID=A0ABY1VM23_9ACTO|nr:histidine kinase [Actinomyces bovis]SPT53148.1 Sensor histidine kinase desK [Actinomyces bovis]VEG52319.1 Sensor histidine kinase desK [Actinomyces israelii]
MPEEHIDHARTTVSVPVGIMRALAWRDAHPTVADVSVSLGAMLLGCPLGLILFPADLPSNPALWVGVALAACTVGLALVFRHRSPVSVWAVVTLTMPAAVLVTARQLELNSEQARYMFSLLTGLTLLAVPLTIGALAARRDMRLCVGAYLVSTMLAVATETAVYPLHNLRARLLAALPFAVINLLGLLVGTLLRVQRQNLAEVRASAARSVLASEQRALLAAASERSRIAREMHDVIAHSLTVMITMADGATATIDRNPQMTKEALKVLAETGRSALADTRRLVGVLREDPSTSAVDTPTADAADAAPRLAGFTAAALSGSPASTPGRKRSGTSGREARDEGPKVRDLPVPEFAPPGTVVPVEPSARIADLRAAATAAKDASADATPTAPAPESGDLEVLVQRFKTAGVPITYTWNGSPLPDDKSLQLTLFRIAQESLTNVLRYAPTTRDVQVQVDRYTGTVVLVVRNDAAPGSTAMHGSGKGLIGMRERAAVYGGQVQAGPTPQGWQVKAVLRWEETDERSSSWQMPS